MRQTSPAGHWTSKTHGHAHTPLEQYIPPGHSKSARQARSAEEANAVTRDEAAEDVAEEIAEEAADETTEDAATEEIDGREDAETLDEPPEETREDAELRTDDPCDPLDPADDVPAELAGGQRAIRESMSSWVGPVMMLQFASMPERMYS